MQDWGSTAPGGVFSPSRRGVLGALVGTCGLAVAGCATLERRVDADVVRRLMAHASERAIGRLVQPDGFWDSPVARIDLPVLLGASGSRQRGPLKSASFREQLQHRLNTLAEAAARRVTPVVSEAVRTVSIENPAAVLGAGRTGATTHLRKKTGPALVNALIHELEAILRVSKDPLLGEALSALADVDMGDAAHAVAIETDNAIWREIGAAEAEIRDDPVVTGDPGLIEALRVS